MDLAQKYIRFRIGCNRKYRILQARRLTTRFGPTVILTVKGKNAAPVQVFLPRRYSDVFLTLTLNKLIQMRYSYISYSKEFALLLKLICWL